MRLVIVESPFAGDVERNIEYARAAARDCLLRGEAPFASHLLYTQDGILNDDTPEERAHGIAAGLEWGTVADATVVYTDLGTSKGMTLGVAHAEMSGRPVEYRTLPGWGPHPKPIEWCGECWGTSTIEPDPGTATRPWCRPCGGTGIIGTPQGSIPSDQTARGAK